MADKPVVDLEAVKKSVEGLSDADLKAKLLSVRVRQKVQIAKSSANSKTYAARQREREKQMKEEAKRRGLFDEVEAEAVVAADAKIEELDLGGAEEENEQPANA